MGVELGMCFQELFNIDYVYFGGEVIVVILLIFFGNYDMGCMLMFICNVELDIFDVDLLDWLILVYGLMMFFCGVLMIYYGDEQGFIFDGNDCVVCEDMFLSVVESYNDNDLVGMDVMMVDNNFDISYLFYQVIV